MVSGASDLLHYPRANAVNMNSRSSEGHSTVFDIKRRQSSADERDERWEGNLWKGKMIAEGLEK